MKRKGIVKFEGFDPAARMIRLGNLLMQFAGYVSANKLEGPFKLDAEAGTITWLDLCGRLHHAYLSDIGGSSKLIVPSVDDGVLYSGSDLE